MPTTQQAISQFYRLSPIASHVIAEGDPISMAAANPAWEIAGAIIYPEISLDVLAVSGRNGVPQNELLDMYVVKDERYYDHAKVSGGEIVRINGLQLYPQGGEYTRYIIKEAVRSLEDRFVAGRASHGIIIVTTPSVADIQKFTKYIDVSAAADPIMETIRNMELMHHAGGRSFTVGMQKIDEAMAFGSSRVVMAQKQSPSVQISGAPGQAGLLGPIVSNAKHGLHKTELIISSDGSRPGEVTNIVIRGGVSRRPYDIELVELAKKAGRVTGASIQPEVDVRARLAKTSPVGTAIGILPMAAVQGMSAAVEAARAAKTDLNIANVFIPAAGDFAAAGADETTGCDSRVVLGVSPDASWKYLPTLIFEGISLDIPNNVIGTSGRSGVAIADFDIDAKELAAVSGQPTPGGFIIEIK